MSYSIAVFTKTGSDEEVYKLIRPFSREWEGFVIGGEYSEMLYSKSKHMWADTLLVKDVDFQHMEEYQAKELISFEEFKEENCFRDEYIKYMYPDEKTYVKKESRFYVDAILDVNGNWIEKKYCSSQSMKERIEKNEEYYKEFYTKSIASAKKKNLYITIVDVCC